MSVTQQVVPPGVWASDALHSSVRFDVGHMGVSMFSAGFVDVDARLLSSPGGLELRGRVAVASFDLHDNALRPHVMAPDFLDVERHPELTFRSLRDPRERERGQRHRRAHHQGEDSSHRGDRQPHRPDRRPVWQRPYRHGSRDGHRPHRVWPRLQISLPNGASALGNEVRLAVVLELVREG